ncbi:MAG: HypC/HybG/HupF family hydrogenase formation chaperone [Gammaproteobacteria bacterium]|nr:HypC/HybG/HupF family hydrogenase formation chaperone [Gammaproteobacteria bacterium]
MCLSVAMKITSINGFEAQCEARGSQRTVNLIMLPENSLNVGDFVMVQLDYAIQQITEEDARKSWEMVDEILTVLEQNVRPADLTSDDAK